MLTPIRIRFLPLVALLAAAPSAAFDTFTERLTAAAIEQTRSRVVYDPEYVKIAYPGGDVAPDRGVCTDVLIRAYRKVGIDLQVEVHEDMAKSFDKYPRNWGRKTPDSNIDHRRVPNLMTFFRRHGEVAPVSRNAEDYRPGDIVAWDLGRGINHIGLVVGRRAGNRYMVVHNIGAGPHLEDVLFNWKIIGHYRYQRAATTAGRE